MEKEIIQQIKKFVKEMREERRMEELHKAGFACGYMAAIADIQRIIDFGESLSGIEQKIKS